MLMLVPSRNEYAIAGLTDYFLILEFNFEPTVEDVPIVSFFTPMKRHFS